MQCAVRAVPSYADVDVYNHQQELDTYDDIMEMFIDDIFIFINKSAPICGHTAGFVHIISSTSSPTFRYRY